MWLKQDSNKHTLTQLKKSFAPIIWYVAVCTCLANVHRVWGPFLIQTTQLTEVGGRWKSYLKKKHKLVVINEFNINHATPYFSLHESTVKCKRSYASKHSSFFSNPLANHPPPSLSVIGPFAGDTGCLYWEKRSLSLRGLDLWSLSKLISYFKNSKNTSNMKQNMRSLRYHPISNASQFHFNCKGIAFYLFLLVSLVFCSCCLLLLLQPDKALQKSPQLVITSLSPLLFSPSAPFLILSSPIWILTGWTSSGLLILLQLASHSAN